MGHHKTFKISQYLLLFTFTFLIGYSQKGHSQMVQAYENGPIHEAFVTRVSGNLAFDASSLQPPSQINERIPRQLDLQAEWIPGYWAWESKVKDFVWVSGVWRRPPPGHQWISGFWKKYVEGWVWVPGFWNRVPLQNVDYIGIPPPDPVDQNTAPPPSNNYFWIPGFWHFLFDQQEYQWILGHWKELDPDWIFVSSYYIWRPGGYVFISAYWDWPLEDRGTAYSSVIIEPDYRYRITFEPAMILRPGTIVRNLYLNYPDYICFFHHHRHFHPDFWHGFCCPPPWWRWDTWWSFTWHDHWSLWWWYTHPGYPQPLWITPELSGILPPPLSELLAMFKYANPPAIVTPNGVVSRGQLLEAIRKATGQFLPILPSDKGLLNKVFRIAKRESFDPSKILKPIGRRLPIDPTAVRPNVRKPVIDRNAGLYTPTIPDNLRPTIPFKPRIPTHGRPPIWKLQPRPVDAPIYTPQVRRPSWTPRPIPQPPQYRPRLVPPVRINPDRLPYQGHREPDYPDPSSRWRPMDPVRDSQISRPPVHTSPIKNRWKGESYPRQQQHGKRNVQFPSFGREANDSDDDDLAQESDDDGGGYFQNKY